VFDRHEESARVNPSRTTVPGFLAFLVSCPVAVASAGHTLTPTQESVLQGWFKENPGHRRATLADCDCATDVQNMKDGYGGEWKGVPDYHPYVATGDFDTDGDEDFAVIVVQQSGARKLLVFNAPFAEPGRPAYVETSLDFRRLALFFGPPRPKPYRLLIGAFESEGALVIPKNGTYVLEWQEY